MQNFDDQIANGTLDTLSQAIQQIPLPMVLYRYLAKLFVDDRHTQKLFGIKEMALQRSKTPFCFDRQLNDTRKIFQGGNKDQALGEIFRNISSAKIIQLVQSNLRTPDNVLLMKNMLTFL